MGFPTAQSSYELARYKVSKSEVFPAQEVVFAARTGRPLRPRGLLDVEWSLTLRATQIMRGSIGLLVGPLQTLSWKRFFLPFLRATFRMRAKRSNRSCVSRLS